MSLPSPRLAAEFARDRREISWAGRAILFSVSVLFVGASQLWLSSPGPIMQPDRGELGWPVGLAITALTSGCLAWAVAPRGGRDVLYTLVVPLLASLWSCLLAMRVVFVLGGVLPWVLAMVGYTIASTLTAPTFIG